jgi:hypothetical protein
MILIIPSSRVCKGKTTKYPITGNIPLLWIKTENEKYSVISIDGFIINNQHNVNGIFKKAEYIIENEGEVFVPEDIFQLISKQEFNIINEFASAFQSPIITLIWPENFPEGYNTTDDLIYSLKFDFNSDETKVSSVKSISLDTLERGIAQLRGFSFKNVKNLNSASSNVECFLANNTKNPWPGDIDTILYDNELKKFIGIIEFKTHNNDTPIENESIGKYGNEDWRRFDVLFDLIDNFNHKLNYRPKLFFIVWGTNLTSANHNNIKIDIIERGRVLETLYINRPEINTFSQELFDLIISKIE